MNTTDLVHFPSADSAPRCAAKRRPRTPSHHELMAPVRQCIFQGRQYLLGQQRLDGSWAGRKSGDVSQLAQWVLLQAYLGREHSELAEQAAASIARDQRPDGGWSLSPGGRFDLSASVVAYFARKVVGVDASQPDMCRARHAIRSQGGADAVDDATRYWLALLGQIDYDCCPPVPPEPLLFSDASAIRAAAPAVVWSLRPQRAMELSHGVRELFIEQPQNWARPFTLRARLWARCERAGFVPLRKWALHRAMAFVETGAGADEHNFDLQQIIWHRVALETLGVSADRNEVAACDEYLRRRLTIDDAHDETNSRSETSLTADTALAIEALSLTGIGLEEPPVIAGLRWLADRRLRADRQGSTARETAAVLRTLTALGPRNRSASGPMPPHIQLARRRCGGLTRRRSQRAAANTLLDRIVQRLCADFVVDQNADGGWSPGGDADCGPSRILRASRRRDSESVPDATGAVLEVLACDPRFTHHRSIRRAVAYLRSAQRGDGSWDSATGARFIHGTSWAIRGLVAAGVAADDPAVAAGVNWLLVQQAESGGWGEAVARAGDAPDYLPADATAIQTAWAVLALVAAGCANHAAVCRGIEFLIEAQIDDGRWCDSLLTVRDSCRGTWYRDALHSVAVPLIALARWTVAIADGPTDEHVSLRLIGADSLS